MEERKEGGGVQAAIGWGVRNEMTKVRRIECEGRSIVGT